MIPPLSIPEFISDVEPFKQLEYSELEKVIQQFQPLKYDMGQIMLIKDKIPPYIAIIYEGKVRCIGYDPRNGLPISLELLSQGSVVGWESLIRGFPCETAIASTDLVALTLDRDIFLNLVEQNPEIKEYYRKSPGLIEVFDSMGYQLNRLAQGEGNLKQFARRARKQAQVCCFPSGKIANLPTPPEGQIWTLSSGKLNNQEIGSIVTLNGQGEIKADTEIRLVSIAIPEPEIRHYPERNNGNGNGNGSSLARIDNGELTEDYWADSDQPSKKEQVKVVKPEILLNIQEIPQADPQILQKQPSTLFAESKIPLKFYPFYSGKTEADIGIACMRMLTKFYKMPFRSDVLNRIITEQVQRNSRLSLEICGPISEFIGLNSQLAGVPAGAFSKLEGPFLTKLSDNLVVVYQTTEKTVVVGDPTAKGVREYKIQDFLESWGQEGKVLLLKKSKETPEEKFGLSWFVPSIIKYKWVLMEVFIASFFVQLFALANPLMIQIIIDKVIVQNSPDTLQVLGIFLVVLAVFEALLTTLRTYSFVDTTNRIDMSLGSEIIDHLLRLPLRYFEKRPVGEISTRINELENIRSFLTGTALTVVLDAIFSVIYIVVMFIYSPLLTFVSIGIIPIFVALTLIFSPLIRRQLREKAERNAHTQSHLVEILGGIQTVKAQNIELQSRWEWQDRYASYVGTGFRTVITQTLAGSMSSFLNKLSQLLVLWVGAYLVLQGDLTLGQLIAFRIISGYVTSPILRLAQLWQNFQQTALSLERLADIVDHPQEAQHDRDNIPMPFIDGNLKYENVCFRFKQHSPLQLNNVSVDIPAGTFVGIVGESGAGKSTFTKLVSRLYEPESGRILIDGYDVNRVELYSLRRQIGVVPQESLLFDGTIMENIALTNPDATSDEVIQAAQTAVAHEFIMKLPNGYNTRVGERGASLSGGQRQRIAIARSVLQNPRLLVLDEATSALDYNTEADVCQNLIQAFDGRTVLFITHRLGTIQNADLIIVMDKGLIDDMGTHEELMSRGGLYFNLYNQQQSSNHKN